MKNNAKSKFVLGLALAMLAIVGAVNLAYSADATADDKDAVGEATDQEKIFSTKIMEATKNSDYAAFLAEGDQGFKTISKAAFNSVCGQISSRLKSGYHLVFLGGCKKSRYHMTLWKVVYDKGGDEDSLELDVRNGKISGAIIH